MSHIFISYARKDGLQYAERLENDLIQQKYSVWRDKRGIDPARDFTAEIERAIDSASHVIVCITPDVERSDSFVHRETLCALKMEKSVFVVRMVEDAALPLHLVAYHTINFYMDWNAALQILCEYIEHSYQKSASPVLRSNTNYPQVFISYRRDDSGYAADSIYERLCRDFATSSIFFDVDGIPPGEEWDVYLRNRVQRCSVMLVVIGKDWLDIRDPVNNERRLEQSGDFVRLEIETAIERNIPLIPLFLDGLTGLPEQRLPVSIRRLAKRQGIPIRRLPDFEVDMSRLVARLQELLKR